MSVVIYDWQSRDEDLIIRHQFLPHNYASSVLIDEITSHLHSFLPPARYYLLHRPVVYHPLELDVSACFGIHSILNPGTINIQTTSDVHYPMRVTTKSQNPGGHALEPGSDLAYLNCLECQLIRALLTGDIYLAPRTVGCTPTSSYRADPAEFSRRICEQGELHIGIGYCLLSGCIFNFVLLCFLPDFVYLTTWAILLSYHDHDHDLHNKRHKLCFTDTTQSFALIIFTSKNSATLSEFQTLWLPKLPNLLLLNTILTSLKMSSMP